MSATGIATVEVAHAACRGCTWEYRGADAVDHGSAHHEETDHNVFVWEHVTVEYGGEGDG